MPSWVDALPVLSSLVASSNTARTRPRLGRWLEIQGRIGADWVARLGAVAKIISLGSAPEAVMMVSA